MPTTHSKAVIYSMKTGCRPELHRHAVIVYGYLHLRVRRLCRPSAVKRLNMHSKCAQASLSGHSTADAPSSPSSSRIRPPGSRAGAVDEIPSERWISGQTESGLRLRLRCFCPALAFVISLLVFVSLCFFARGKPKCYTSPATSDMHNITRKKK